MKNFFLPPIFLAFIFFTSSSAYSANRYVRAAGGDFNAASTWSGTGSGGVDVVAVPTAADNVILQVGSGQLTINVNSVCRSIDANAYTNTITHASGVTLTIGDATAGTGNIALRFAAGMTYAPAGATSEISFVSTSATLQSITWGGKTTGNVTFNAGGLNGSWSYSTSHTTLPSATVTLTRGTFNTNGNACTWGLFTSIDGLARTLTLGASVITLTGVGNVWDMSTTTTLTMTANTSTIIINDTSIVGKTFIGGNMTFNIITLSGDNITISGSNTFSEMIVANAGLTTGLIFVSGSTQTITSLKTNGFASNLAKIKSDTNGVQAILSKASGIISVDYMSIQDIQATTSGSAEWYAGINSVNVSGNGGGAPWQFINSPARYWVTGGDGLWNNTNNWSATSNGPSGASIPLLTNDVIFDAFSGNGTSTINVASAVRSLNTTGFTGYLVHNAVTLSIGENTPGQNNSALIFDSNTTYTLVNNTSSAISFVSNAIPTLLINWGGKTTGNVSFNGTGSWIYMSEHTCSSSAKIDLIKGALNTNSQIINTGQFNSSLSNVRTLTLGNSILNLAGTVSATYFNVSNTTTLTVTANTATINILTGGNSAFFTSGTMDWTGLDVNITGGGRLDFFGGTGSTYNNLTISGGAGTILVVQAFGLIITGAFTANGTSNTERLFIDGLGAGRTIAATVFTGQYLNIKNVTMTTLHDLQSIIGGSSDQRGNTNILFTTGVAVYWFTVGGGTKLWSDVANWRLSPGGAGATQGRIPLAQDDVIFDSNSINSANTIIDTNFLTNLGKNINWAGVQNNPEWTITGGSLYGSLTLDVGMTITIKSSTLFLAGNDTDSNYTITTNGAYFPINLTCSLTGKTLTFNDDFNASPTSLLQFSGTVLFNDKNLTTGRIQINSSSNITMGSGLFKLTGVGTVWSCNSAANFTTNSSIIEISDATAFSKTFAGGGKTYNKLLISGAGNAIYTFTGNNSFFDFWDNKTSTHTLQFTAGSTTTFTGTGSPGLGEVKVNGSSGNIITISSTTTAIFTWTQAAIGGVVNCDYINLVKSTATAGGSTFSATNSIDGGGNTNWNFPSLMPYVWTGADSGNNLNWSNPFNWSNTGVAGTPGAPGINDVAYFTGAYLQDCNIDTPITCKGINVSLAYSGGTNTITQNNTMTIGIDGFEICGGIFAGGSQSITSAGRFRQSLGTFTNTSGIFEITAQGTSSDTWIVSGGTHIPNGGTVKISGSLDAIVTNSSGRQMSHLELNTTGITSGTIFVDGNLTRTQGPTLNATISLKGDYLGTGAFGYSAGTGNIKFIGSLADQNFICPYAPSIEINKSAFTLIVPADIYIGGNWKHTAGAINWNNKKVTFDNINVGQATITSGSFYDVEFAKQVTDNIKIALLCTINNNLTISSLANINDTTWVPDIRQIELWGNYTTNLNSWGGTTKLVFKGATANTFTGTGKQGVSAEVYKPGGSLELFSDLDMPNTGQDLVVRSGNLKLSTFNLTVNDTLTVYDTMTLSGLSSQIITVNGTTTLATNANFTISATSSTIIYSDGAGTAIVTNLKKDFYNLTFGANKTHEFATGAPNLTTINGALASNGTNGTRSILRSVADVAIDWKLTLNGTSTLADKVNVKRSDASGGLGVLATGSISGGNNTNWVGLVVVPLVTNITSSSADGTYSSGVIPISITFSEPVNVTGSPTLTLETGTTDQTITYTSGTGTATLIFDYTIQSGDTSADLDYVATSSLALNGGTIMNAGNTQNAILELPAPGATGSLGANKALVITPITITTITGVSSSTANGTYKVGDAISIQVTFSSLVNVTGSPTLTLETGTTDRAVTYSSGSGTTVLVFTYTVQNGDTSADLDYVGTTSLALNGGTIKNAGGTDATLTLATPGAVNSLGANKDFIIDSTVPTVTGVSSSKADGSYNAGTVILITVTFSEAVTGTSVPILELETGTTDRTATYTSGSGTTSLVFTYTVQSGDVSTDLDYTATTSLALAGGTIKDIALNDAVLTLATPGAANSLGANKAILIDTSIPVVLSVSSSTASGAYKAGATIVVTITFDEAVVVSGVPKLTLETGTTDRTANYASGSGSTILVFNYTVQSGDISSDLDYTSTSALSLSGGTINDASLNAATLTLAEPGAINSLGANNSLIIDTTVPTITSQFLDAGFTYIEITFSEAVYAASSGSGGLETADFTLTFAKNGGTATGITITDVKTTSGGTTAGGETTFRLSLSVAGLIAGTETFTISPTSNSIFDIASNPAPTSTNAGTLGVTDGVVPTITNVTSSTADGTYKAGDVISIQVTFSESVTVTGIPKLTLETGATDQAVNYASGSGTTILTFTYTVQSGDTSSDLEVQSTTALDLNGGTILDVAGNAATLTLPTLGATSSLGFNKAIVVDTTAPTILSLTLDSLNKYVEITFSEPVYTNIGNGSIVQGDFGIDFLSNGGTATGVSITSIVSPTDLVLVGGEKKIRIYIQVSGVVSGKETITVKALADSIFDLIGNILAAKELSGTLTKEGGVDTGSSGGGGGCQYARNVDHQNVTGWMLYFLMMLIVKIIRKQKGFCLKKD